MHTETDPNLCVYVTLQSPSCRPTAHTTFQHHIPTQVSVTHIRHRGNPICLPASATQSAKRGQFYLSGLFSLLLPSCPCCKRFQFNKVDCLHSRAVTHLVLFYASLCLFLEPLQGNVSSSTNNCIYDPDKYTERQSGYLILTVHPLCSISTTTFVFCFIFIRWFTGCF